MKKAQKNCLTILASLLVSIVFAQSVAADDKVSANYLGASGNPNPTSLGGISPAVNNLPNARNINGNWSANAATNYAAYPTKNTLEGQPAWAQDSYKYISDHGLLPFGASLFKGYFANTYSDNMNADYMIAPGDRIVFRMWGAKQYDDVLAVDQQGNIFIPEIGPVHVSGIPQSGLLNTIKNKVSQVFTNNVDIYVNLQSSQPIGVFVTGFVNNPGQYAGGTYDSVLSFIDRAGGIDFSRGSFRQIAVKRNNQVIANVDLYDFVLQGKIKNIRLYDGDVILVSQKKTSVNVYGLVKQEAVYELSDTVSGQALISMASPLNKVSHVSITGTRNNIPIHQYLTLNDFKNFNLVDGDTVDFVADKRGESIMASVSGAITGASRYPIAKSTRLRDFLSYVEVDPNLADTASVYIKRRSVAEQQKTTIRDSLRRLEQSALTATSGSVDEAEIRVQEAKLIQDFVKRAEQYQPDGIVVVSRGGITNDILLEDGDEIVIPQMSDVVLISGEVMMPKAVTFDKNMSLDDFLAAAGGVSNRADDEHILVAKANGEVGLAEDLGISAGDRILVMPKFDTKNMQLAKDIMQILYQMAVATKVVIDL